MGCLCPFSQSHWHILGSQYLSGIVITQCFSVSWVFRKCIKISQHFGEKTLPWEINHAVSQGYTDLTILSTNEQYKWIYDFRENTNTELKMSATGISTEGTWLILEFLQKWDYLYIFCCLYDNCHQNSSICLGITDTIITIKQLD